jgi:hypothetical protein
VWFVKKFRIFLILSLVLISLGFLAYFFFSNVLSHCVVGDTLDVGGKCFHVVSGDSCGVGESYLGGKCFYDKIPTVEKRVGVWFFILPCIFAVVVVIIHLVQLGFFKDKKFVDWDEKNRVDFSRGVELVKLSVSRDFGLQYNDKGGVDETNFRVYGFKRPYFHKASGEIMVIFGLELLKGAEFGLYSVMVSLSRGEDWIKGGNFSFVRENVNVFKPWLYTHYLGGLRLSVSKFKSDKERLLSHLSEDKQEEYILGMMEGKGEESGKVNKEKQTGGGIV